MKKQEVYDRIGRTYTSTRQEDPRIARLITNAIGEATSLVNVGAGTGAYEPTRRGTVAVEPSWQMIQQRSPGAIPVVRAVAEALPFPPDSFDVALAVLTLHHWTDWRAGIAELTRVAQRVVVLTFDVDTLDDFWLTSTYFPDIAEFDRRRSPSIVDIAAALEAHTTTPVPIPHDCVDGFLAAFWRRPERYLDPAVRAGISAFAQLDQHTIAAGVDRLTADLASGAWERRFGKLRTHDSFDAGYRLLVSDRKKP